MNSIASPPTSRAIAERFRFEPGSYGETGAFTPAIACLQQVQPEAWEYYFILVKPRKVHTREPDAIRDAEDDLQAAFRQRKQTGSDITVAENLRAKGYFKVDNFRIAAEEVGNNGIGFRQ